MIDRDMETQAQDDNSKGSTKLSPTDKERITDYWASDSNNTTPTSERNDLADNDESRTDNRRRQTSTSTNSKTSFSVDDILSPSKFTGQLHNITPEYFMQWQPWLMHEMLRHHHHQHHQNAASAFSNVTLSIYKPFLSNHLKDGKFSDYNDYK